MKIGLCAIAKLENHYVREWVEHYKKLGISKIFIYDNNDIDGEKFDDVIGDYIKSKFVVIFNRRGVKATGEYNFQTQCYTDCYNLRCDDLDWVCFFDLDEFLELEHFEYINDFVNQDKFKDFNTIKVCWKNYTDNNLIEVKNNDYSLQKRFTKVLDTDSPRNTEYKSIVKCKQPGVTKVTAHLPFECKACDVTGEINTSDNCFLGKRVWSDAYLKHYRTKTLSEFIEQKVQRGTDGNGKGSISNSFDLFFEYNTKTDEKLNYIKNLP